MNALAHNAIAQTSPVARATFKLAICAGLALVITLMSARLTNHSVVQAYMQAAQVTPTVQLIVPLAPNATPAITASRNRI